MLPAPDLATVSRYPFSGNWPVDGYSKEVDPWQREDFAKYRCCRGVCIYNLSQPAPCRQAQG
jgi:hypothetical protein